MTFEQIVRRALDAGFIEEARGRETDWLSSRIFPPSQSRSAAHHAAGRRASWIMVSERKTAEGGIVAVYSDITEPKRA